MSTSEVCTFASNLVGVWICDSPASEVLCTVEEEGVVQTGLERTTWPWGASHLVPASRAVHSAQTGRLAVVVTDTYVQRKRALFWPQDFAGTLLNAPVSCSLSLPQDSGVNALFANPSSGATHDFVAVLDDGTILLLESTMGTMMRLSSPRLCSFVRAKLDHQVLCVCHTSLSGMNGSVANVKIRLQLSMFPFSSPNNSEIRTVIVPQISEQDDLQDFAVCGNLLTCLWHSGRLSILDIPAMSKTCTVRHLVPLPPQFSLPEHSQKKGVKRRNGMVPAAKPGAPACRVVALRHHAIAVVSPRIQQEGSTASCLLVNTIFGTVTDSGRPPTLQCSSAEQGLIVEADQASSSVFAADSGSYQDVVLAAGGQVVRWGIAMAEATLANVVGSLASSGPQAESTTNTDATAFGAATVLQLDVTQLKGQQEDSIGGFVRPCNHRLVPSGQPGQDVHSDMQQVLALREVGNDLALVEGVLEQCCDRKALPPSNMVEQLAGWLAEHEQWTALQRLTSSRKFLSLRRCPSILRACVDAEQYRPLLRLLRHAEDLDEEDLGRLLEALLGRVDATVDSPGSESAEALRKSARGAAEACCAAAERHTTTAKLATAACACAAVDGFTGAHLVLHAVLACKLDSRVLRKACDGLRAAAVGALLAYLQEWLDRMLGSCAGSWFSAVKWVDMICCPSLQSVVRWSEVLVDRHSSKLVVDQNAQAHLRLMAESLHSACATAEKLGACAGMAKQCLKMPSAAGSSQHERFSLEVLDLRVDKNV